MSSSDQKTLRRFLDIIPGLLTWTAILAPVLLSFKLPWLVAVFVLVFDLYWLFRSLRMVVNTIRTYRFMRHDLKTDWHAVLESDLPKERNGIELVAKELPPQSIYHAIILVYYKEPVELILKSVESYAASKIGKEKLWLVLASEERAGESAGEVYDAVKKAYGDRFGVLVRTIHPAHLPGEIKCKSANGTWAAKELRKILDEKSIGYEQVLVHNFDADTRVYVNYFDYVACKYLAQPVNQPTSFQPVHTYSNNIWDVPALMRVLAQSSTLIFMHNMLRPSRFHHFSSRSDVFKTIVDIGYWAVDAIPEDSRQYYNSYFYYGGHLKIEPIYVPLRMDAVLADGYWQTVLNQYRQLRRWAWGASDFSYVVVKAINDRKISWWHKLGQIFRLLESHFSWAVAALYVSFLGWVPLWANADFGNTVLGYNFPIFTRWILSAALVGLITGVILSYLLLPPRPKHRSSWFYLNFLWQWILSPVASIFLSSVAAIDAQTRLMFGKRLEYQITEKAVAKTDS